MRITNAQNDISHILFTEEQIARRVEEMGRALTAEYKDEAPLMVCILKGAVFFYADLCRSMGCPVFLDFIAISSYGESAQSSGIVRLIKDLDTNIMGRHVIIVEDIIDSGLTLQYLVELFSSRKPASIRTVCLLDKYAKHKPLRGSSITGFFIEDEFVVGYGLDYAGHYRNLPYIGILKPEVYECL